MTVETAPGTPARRRPHRRAPRWRARAAAAWALVLLVAGDAGAATTARVMYERAVERDHAVRAAMARTDTAAQPTLQGFRDAVAAYRAVVWQFPTSGYCDNALWQGAQLAIEAFDRHGQERDRESALALLKHLVSEYPHSDLVRRARGSIARVEALRRPVAAGPTARPAAEPHPEAPADDPAPLVSVAYVQRDVSPDRTDVVVYLDGPVTFREERLDNPARVFFDLPRTRPAEALKDAILSFESGLVRQVRIGRHPNAVTRIVIDAEGVARHRAQVFANPHRLVVTCWPTAVAATAGAPPAGTPPASAPAAGAPLPAARPVLPTRALRQPPVGLPDSLRNIELTGEMAPEGPVAVADPARAAAPPAPVIVSPAPAATPPALPGAPAAPASNLRGGYSLARQLGLGASRIVIDAGHGGHDPGSMAGTVAEATIALDIALRLEKLLLKQPGIEVVLTRRTDEYLTLQERTDIANRENADLFLSIHVNASPSRTARGVETYLLDFASTPEAEAIAARENASTDLTMTHLNDLVKRIALTTKADESRDFAVHVQRSMVRRLRPYNAAMRDLGVKRAPFVVLIGASMPSVLVEVAFLTHPQERRLLNTTAYRQRVAESLLDGVRRYLQALKSAAPTVQTRPPAKTGAPGSPDTARLPLQ